MNELYDGRHFPDSDPLEPEAPVRGGPTVHDIAAAVMGEHNFLETAAGVVFRYNGAWWSECTKETLAALIWRADNSVASLRKRGEVAALIRATRHAEDLE